MSDAPSPTILHIAATLPEHTLHAMVGVGNQNEINVKKNAYLSVGCLISSESPFTYASYFAGVSLRRGRKCVQLGNWDVS